VLTLGVGSTFAFWTDDVVIQGTTLTSGTLDLNVNGGDPYSTSTLSMTVMVPGNSSAEVLNVNNVGTAPAKYTLTGGLIGTDAATYSAAGVNGLLLSITSGTRSGSGSSATCGGTVLYGPTPLTSTTTTPLLGRRPTSALVAVTGTEALCFQIKLSDTADTGLQGKTATATFTATGTSDVS
jgi:predicted ribosomally synthesized peptide with SipW-like signal peptide